jgi:OOP family OmpA-OmpF porin
VRAKHIMSNRPAMLLMATALALPAAPALAQSAETQDGDVMTTVYANAAEDIAALPKGPEVKGVISARSGNQLQITTDDGNQLITVVHATKIRGKGGFLGAGTSKLAADSLLNGLPVTIDTVQGETGLIASDIKLANKDLKIASMIRSGTNQRFDEQAAATEALRGRMGDIDKYNVKSTTNVYFDTGKHNLSGEAQQQLCAAATTADGIDNALLLVVGYTDSTGDPDFNQVLSERRASRVVNYLQQACGWKPYRMLTPTGMASSDPQADNYTAQGKAQNRRVSVNVLVSKGLDGI